eukprot:136379-Amphidinium_carterae.1
MAEAAGGGVSLEDGGDRPDCVGAVFTHKEFRGSCGGGFESKHTAATQPRDDRGRAIAKQSCSGALGRDSATY